MIVPENIGGNGVDAHGFGTTDAVAPVFLRHTGVVHLAADELHGLSVEQELAVFNLEVVGLDSGPSAGNQEEQETDDFFLLSKVCFRDVL